MPSGNVIAVPHFSQNWRDAGLKTLQLGHHTEKRRFSMRAAPANAGASSAMMAFRVQRVTRLRNAPRASKPPHSVTYVAGSGTELQFPPETPATKTFVGRKHWSTKDWPRDRSRCRVWRTILRRLP